MRDNKIRFDICDFCKKRAKKRAHELNCTKREPRWKGSH